MQSKRQKISVRLTRQAVLPVCTAAIEEWKQSTRFKTCGIAISSRMDEKKAKAWIDDALFKRVVIDLLEIAAGSGGKRDEISFSIIPGNLGSCCVAIGYLRAIEKSDPYEGGMDTGPGEETCEIISQHRGKIEIVEEKHHKQFLIHFPH